MQLLLFGPIGSGKSYIGELLAQDFGLHYHDADRDLPAEALEAIGRHEPFTEAMREQFLERIIARIRGLAIAHPRFVVAQALFRNHQRARLLEAFPSLQLVWVRSSPEQIAERLRARTGHIASSYYATTINPGFELPTVPHLVLDNIADPDGLRLNLVRLLALIHPPR